MQGNTYLIPANTKRGQLIFNLFTKLDLIILAIGVGITLIFILVMTADSLLNSIIILGPGLLAGFLVLPIPNYHNVLTVIITAFTFFSERRRYIWKGWCFYDQT